MTAIAPLGNGLAADKYSAGRTAALEYARANGYEADCAFECATQWGDMDANAHVNNTVPLRWCESGRGVYMAAVVSDLSPSAFDDKARADLLKGEGSGKSDVVGEVRYRYMRPIYHPDNLLVLTRAATINPKYLTLKTVVYSYAQQAPVGTAEATLFQFDHDEGRSAPWHEAIVEGLVRRGAEKRGFERREGDGEGEREGEKEKKGKGKAKL